MHHRLIYVLLALALPAAQAPAQAPANATTPAVARRLAVTDSLPVGSRATATSASAIRATRAPVLDGKTTDPIWAEAQVIDQFLEYEPRPAAETRFKTEVRIAYDDKHLYVLARMFDPAPDSIMSLLSRRDVRTQSEQLKLVIDSYHDKRTAYQFITNPAGVKRDFYVYNDNTEDVTWDAVWDVATAIDSLGWVAEFRIPFSQIRFNNLPEHTFGLLIVRDVARTNARISWPLYSRDRQGYVSQAGELRGITGLAMPRRLEVAPYSVAKNVTRTERPAPGQLRYSHPSEITFGADVKYGLSSNLTLDATLNPDFGQVEADPAVLNLSAFEQFFEERRPFFLEGAGIFALNTSCGDIDTGCRGLFYSRRIGRSPQLHDGDPGSPLNATILGATKLAGRLGRGLSVGALAAVTQKEEGATGQMIEPQTTYGVMRLQQELSTGRGDVGLMLTAVDRALDATTDDFLRGSAYTGGVDFRHRYFQNNYELRASLAGSLVSGTTQAIERLQRDGIHRFQRPDDNQAVDPTATRLVGASQRVSFSKFGGGITRFQSVYQRFSPGFESNDLGFQSRADEQMFRNWFSINLNKPGRYYRRGNFNFNTFQTWTSEGLPLARAGNVNWHLELPNQWWVHVGGNADGVGATYSDRVARGGPAVRQSFSSNYWGGVELDRRWRVTPVFFAGVSQGDEGNSHGWWINPSFQLRISSRFNGSLGVNVSRDNNDAQWHSNVGVAGAEGTRYTFARLEQTTVSMTSRLNFTATPTLSLQMYAQPYISTGTYSDWRELAAPRAEAYADRYRPYSRADGRGPGGIDFKQLRTNTVLRWEYRPGSTLFAVWQQGRQDFASRPMDFDFGRSRQELFGLHPDNTFLVKMSYWFNP